MSLQNGGYVMVVKKGSLAGNKLQATLIRRAPWGEMCSLDGDDSLRCGGARSTPVSLAFAETIFPMMSACDWLIFKSPLTPWRVKGGRHAGRRARDSSN